MEEDFVVLEKSGNTAVSAVYEAKLQGKPKDQQKSLRGNPGFITMKYQEGIFFCPEAFSKEMIASEWMLVKSGHGGGTAMATEVLLKQALMRQDSTRKGLSVPHLDETESSTVESEQNSERGLTRPTRRKEEHSELGDSSSSRLEVSNHNLLAADDRRAGTRRVGSRRDLLAKQSSVRQNSSRRDLLAKQSSARLANQNSSRRDLLAKQTSLLANQSSSRQLLRGNTRNQSSCRPQYDKSVSCRNVSSGRLMDHSRQEPNSSTFTTTSDLHQSCSSLRSGPPRNRPTLQENRREHHAAMTGYRQASFRNRIEEDQPSIMRDDISKSKLRSAAHRNRNSSQRKLGQPVENLDDSLDLSFVVYQDEKKESSGNEFSSQNNNNNSLSAFLGHQSTSENGKSEDLLEHDCSDRAAADDKCYEFTFRSKDGTSTTDFFQSTSMTSVAGDWIPAIPAERHTTTS